MRVDPAQLSEKHMPEKKDQQAEFLLEKKRASEIVLAESLLEAENKDTGTEGPSLLEEPSLLEGPSSSNNEGPTLPEEGPSLLEDEDASRGRQTKNSGPAGADAGGISSGLRGRPRSAGPDSSGPDADAQTMQVALVRPGTSLVQSEFVDHIVTAVSNSASHGVNGLCHGILWWLDKTALFDWSCMVVFYDAIVALIFGGVTPVALVPNAGQLIAELLVYIGVLCQCHVAPHHAGCAEKVLKSTVIKLQLALKWPPATNVVEALQHAMYMFMKAILESALHASACVAGTAAKAIQAVCHPCYDAQHAVARRAQMMQTNVLHTVNGLIGNTLGRQILKEGDACELVGVGCECGYGATDLYCSKSVGDDARYLHDTKKIFKYEPDKRGRMRRAGRDRVDNPLYRLGERLPETFGICVPCRARKGEEVMVPHSVLQNPYSDHINASGNWYAKLQRGWNGFVSVMSPYGMVGGRFGLPVAHGTSWTRLPKGRWFKGKETEGHSTWEGENNKCGYGKAKAWRAGWGDWANCCNNSPECKDDVCHNCEAPRSSAIQTDTRGAPAVEGGPTEGGSFKPDGPRSGLRVPAGPSAEADRSSVQVHLPNSPLDVDGQSIGGGVLSGTGTP